MNRKIYYYVCSALILLSCLFAFTTADKKICDLFLQNKNPVDKETDIFRIKNGGVMQDDKIGININREMYAESVLILRELGANVICIDDDFSHQGAQNIFFDEDEYLANCIREYDPADFEYQCIPSNHSFVDKRLTLAEMVAKKLASWVD